MFSPNIKLPSTYYFLWEFGTSHLISKTLDCVCVRATDDGTKEYAQRWVHLQPLRPSERQNCEEPKNGAMESENLRCESRFTLNWPQSASLKWVSNS